jgi:RNA polymerase sigma factor (sigma-70 family)
MEVMSSTPAEFTVAFPGLAVIAHRVAYRVLGNTSEAEEVTQETLARALVRWRRIGAYAEPWTATTASNLAIGVWRRKRRVLSGLRADSPRPDEYVNDRLELVQLLRGLPRRQREVVVLRYLADLPESAVAEALGCSVGTVKQHAHRGLAALRLSIDPTMGGER